MGNTNTAECFPFAPEMTSDPSDESDESTEFLNETMTKQQTDDGTKSKSKNKKSKKKKIKKSKTNKRNYKAVSLNDDDDDDNKLDENTMKTTTKTKGAGKHKSSSSKHSGRSRNRKKEKKVTFSTCINVRSISPAKRTKSKTKTKRRRNSYSSKQRYKMNTNRYKQNIHSNLALVNDDGHITFKSTASHHLSRSNSAPVEPLSVDVTVPQKPKTCLPDDPSWEKLSQCLPHFFPTLSNELSSPNSSSNSLMSTATSSSYALSPMVSPLPPITPTPDDQKKNSVGFDVEYKQQPQPQSDANQIEGQCSSTVQNCPCVKRIIRALKWYAIFNDDNDRDMLLKKINKKNYGKYILSDYEHILNAHLSNKNNINIENEYNLICTQMDKQIKFCSISKCKGFKRYFKNKNVMTKGQNLHKPDNQLYIEQLDAVHCYFMHLEHC